MKLKLCGMKYVGCSQIKLSNLKTFKMHLIIISLLYTCLNYYASLSKITEHPLIPALESRDICQEPVRYSVDKIQYIGSGKVSDQPIELLVNPRTNTISLKSESFRGGEIRKYAFDVIITKSTCSITDDFASGEATYSGYISQSDGTKSLSFWTVTAKGGVITISESSPEEGRKASYIMLVSKWEYSD